MDVEKQGKFFFMIKRRLSEWNRGESKSEFAPERELLTDNPQPSGPRLFNGSASICIARIRVCHPCGMVLSTAHDLINLQERYLLKKH